MLKNILIVLALLAISRFIGLPSNFSPLLAFAVFVPRITDKKNLQILLPTFILLATNYFLEPVNFFILLSITMVFILTPLLSIVSKNLVFTSVSSVFIWHLIVNSSVWIVNGGSMMETFLLAIPFDFKLLISTCLYVAMFYSVEKIYFNIRTARR